MTQISHITFTAIAGPFDWPLMVIVLGTMGIALVANIPGLSIWLRGRR
jgi:hypothetical protein